MDTYLRDIEPGQRDRTVTILTVAASAPGFPTDTTDTLCTVQMARKYLGAAERAQAFGIEAGYDARWVMAYRRDMDPDEVDVPKVRRLLVGTRHHDIVAAEVLGRRDGIVLTTRVSSRVPA